MEISAVQYRLLLLEYLHVRLREKSFQAKGRQKRDQQYQKFVTDT